MILAALLCLSLLLLVWLLPRNENMYIRIQQEQ